MHDVSAQSQHICSGVQDCEHQWLCQLFQHYWFVAVVVWVVVGGLVLVWVVFLPLLTKIHG